MKHLKFTLLFAIVISLHVSVEAKRTQDYRYIEFEINTNGNETYAVAVLDKREVVTDGSQAPDFVGYVRSTVGIAWPLSTESTSPFAEDVTFAIKNAMEKSGAEVISQSTEYTMGSEEVVEKLKATNADKLVLVTINKWRNDTKSYFNKIATDMIWDLTLQIYDANGEMVAENNVSGLDGALNPSKKTNQALRQELIDTYFKEKMEELFSGMDVPPSSTITGFQLSINGFNCFSSIFYTTI